MNYEMDIQEQEIVPNGKVPLDLNCAKGQLKVSQVKVSGQVLQRKVTKVAIKVQNKLRKKITGLRKKLIEILGMNSFLYHNYVLYILLFSAF